MTNIFKDFFASHIKEKPDFISKHNQLEDYTDNDCTTLDSMLLEMPNHLLNLRLEIAKQENDYIGSWEIETIKKARFYNIPYKPNDIDWSDLENRIIEYEAMLQRAEELNFDWDLKTYEPIALASAIEDCELDNNRSWYYNFLYKIGNKKHA
jgi:hypothetical protein